MAKVDISFELETELTTMDVWRWCHGDGPEMLFSMSRHYHVPIDALGWCARIATLAALDPSGNLHTLGIASDEIDVRC